MSQKTKRPLSPHLQIYKPQLTSVMSILHRLCGAALAVGLVLVVWLLLAAATGESAYDQVIAFCNTMLGKAMLFGWSVALFYHLSNGIRHLFWDTGRLFDLDNAYRAGYLVLASTVILTGLTWWVLCPFKEGP